MSCPQILIVPLPEHGHVLPSFVLSKRLCDMGYAVTCLTHSRFRVMLESAGVAFQSFSTFESETENDDGSTAWLRLRAGHVGVSISDVFEREIALTMRSRHVDLILVDAAIIRSGGRTLPQRFGIDRFVVYSTALPAWSERDVELAPVPHIILCPEFVEIPQFISRHPNVVYAEPSCGDRIERPTHERSNMVLVSFGSQASRYRELPCILRTLFTTASTRSELEFRIVAPLLDEYAASVPGNVVPLYPHEFSSSFQRAAVFISHGGLGGVKEALFVGIPHIILPQLYDQELNAARCTYHEWGTAVSQSELSTKTLNEALDLSFGNRFGNALQLAQEKIWRAEEQSPAVKLITTLL